jgi:FkbH-like protein
MSDIVNAEGRRLKIALLANCTMDLLQDPLTAELRARGRHAEFWVAGFNQFRQEILNPDSGLYRFVPDFVLIYLAGEDLLARLLQNPFDFNAESRRNLAQSCVTELDGLVSALAERLPRTTILLNTIAVSPKNTLIGLEYNSELSFRQAVSKYNFGLSELARRNPNAVVVDVESLITDVGYKQWHDVRLWYLAWMRCSQKAIQLLAERYSTTICSRLGQIRKCLVLDLDNTLWGGVIGELGIAGIQLGNEGPGLAFREFQAELLNLYRKGILLAICSKNNSADALEAIRAHRSMVLKESHFAAAQINWDDKVKNIEVIAKELNIGLDSLVFIDDNPVERARVRRALPEVLVPEWPEDPMDFKTAVLDLEESHFLKLNITTEDRERGSLYHAQAQLGMLASRAESLEEFYRTLQMSCVIEPASPFQIPRIAQLTQKTNQFNLTTRRYSEVDIAAFVRDSRYLVMSLELNDRFGSNGIVGVMVLYNSSPGTWTIDTLLLSCRVIGRTVENAFLGFVCGELKRQKAHRLIGEFRPTAKNKLVENLFESLGFRFIEEHQGASFWELDIEAKGIGVPPWFKIVPGDKEERP